MNKFLRITLIALITISTGSLLVLHGDVVISEKTEANLISEEDMIKMHTEYSDDQEKFIENFGRPDSWDITFNKNDEPVIETWKYMEIGEAITFADAEFIDRVEFEVEAPDDSVLIISKMEPKDVYGIDSVFELNSVLDARPSASADMEDVDWMGANKYYEYDEIVNAGTHDGNLVYVKTKSFYVPISELNNDSDIENFRNEVAYIE
ncbi:hypothetical protein ACFL21_04085 [Patescibacteria group bacterium]